LPNACGGRHDVLQHLRRRALHEPALLPDLPSRRSTTASTGSLRCAPQATVDALLFELRANGFAQLEKPTCLRRLADLSTAQLREINAALVRLKPRYPKITQEMIVILRGQL
jgi:hypothetical protein